MRDRIHHALTLVVLMTGVLCVAGWPVVRTDPFPDSVSTQIFFWSWYVAQHFLFAILFGLLVYPALLFVRRPKLQLAIVAFLVTIFLIMVFLNAKVYSFWRLHINFALISMMLSEGGGGKVFEMSDASFFWLIRACIFSLLAGIVITLISLRFDRRFPVKTIVGLFGTVYITAQSAFIYFSASEKMVFLQYTLKLPLSYEFSVAHLLQKIGMSVFPKNSISVKMQQLLTMDKPLHYPLHPLRYHPPQEKLNVLLIGVDTLRYDMVNPVNMPHVYQFSKKSHWFSNNISGGDCTQPGIFTLFYGIPATYWKAALTHQRTSIIIQAFQDQHYDLALFGSAPFLQPQFSKTVFAHVPHLQVMTEGETPLDRDKTITGEMHAFLMKASITHRPFFGFIFYDAPHAYNAIGLEKPFTPADPLQYFTVNNDSNPIPHFHMYKNAVFANDRLIGDLLTTLERRHLLKNTIVIITSDHGQEYNEYHNNYWEHANGFSQYQVRTPLLIYWPGKSPMIHHERTTHFDFAPTLLKGVLGVTNPASDYSVGNDFFEGSVSERPLIVANYAYPAILWKNYIMEFHDSGLYRFTDHQMNRVTPIPDLQKQLDNSWEEMYRWFKP